MLIEVDIIDFVYKDIQSFCEYNNLDIKEYMSELICDGHSTRKFGDKPRVLTPSITKEQSFKQFVDEDLQKKSKEEEKTEDKIEEVVKKPEPVIEQTAEEKPKTKRTTKKKVDQQEVVDEENKPVRKKRTIKAK